MKVTNHGTICLVHPESDAEAKWLNVTAPEDAQFFGEALAVEPRYVNGVLEAYENDDYYGNDPEGA